MDTKNLLKLADHLPGFFESLELPDGSTHLDVVEAIARSGDFGVDFSRAVQFLSCPEAYDPEFDKKMRPFLEKLKDEKGEIDLKNLRECCYATGRQENLIKFFTGEVNKNKIAMIFRLKAQIEDWKSGMVANEDLLQQFERKTIEMFGGCKTEELSDCQEEFYNNIKSSLENGAGDSIFQRSVLQYIPTFIQYNPDFFLTSFLLEQEDLPSKMSGKAASECVKVLKDLLEKYPDCQEQIREKFLKTNLNQDLKEKILDAQGWVAPKMREKKQEDVSEEKSVAAANRREAFSRQGIRIGGSDLDDKQSADSKEDIENLKKENRDLFNENNALKKLLKEKDLIIEKFYEFQKKQQEALLGLQNSGAEFVERMKGSEREAEANADASRKNNRMGRGDE
jgi:hypothetical protein